jgi:release factor glutamine methyltransferase
VSIIIQTVSDIRKLLRRELSELYYEKEIDSVTNIILKTLFGLNRLHQLSEPGVVVTPEIRSRIVEISSELKTGKPVQYILGETEFYDIYLKLNQHVLIPRQETEELVDIIIRENKDLRGRIIDFATGSGCIAIALAKNITGAVLTATDISEEALALASENALLNGVNITLVRADLTAPFPATITPFDIIVSNPPYVMESEKKFMHRNVLGFEPHISLFVPDNDPLLFYRHLLKISGIALNRGGKVYFEINEAMGNDLEKLMKESGFSEIKIIRDLNGKERIIKGRLNG